MFFPRMNENKLQGMRGETYMQHFVYEKLNCIYHKVSQENDYGIDGYIELVQNGRVTGKRIALQIKHGNSYFKKKTTIGYKYVGFNKHLNYYLNTETPIFIILLDENFERMKWVQFKIEKTMPVGENSWWIEVPEKNNLEKNFKKSIFEAAGPIVDYKEQIQKNWIISEVFQSADSMTIAITKEEIESLDFSYILNYICCVSRNKEMLLAAKNTLNIFFPEYIDDSRELFQIPEVVQWLKKSVEIGIPWFFFLDYKQKNDGLNLLLEAFCVVIANQKAEDILSLVIDLKKFGQFLELNFCNLNIFTEENEIDNRTNIDISESIVAYYKNQLKPY